MRITIGYNPYVLGFWFDGGRWALNLRHLSINCGYFV